MKILCIGEEWRGSNASGMFNALSRLGHLIFIHNELSFLGLRSRTVPAKALNWLLRSVYVSDFNFCALRLVESFRPDLIFVYKGAFLKAETVFCWKRKGIPIVNFFPDVSFLAHGTNIPECVPLFDHLFTTKTFGARDLRLNFGVDESNVSFIPHGFDPGVHRPVSVDSGFVCDASFIGNSSLHKIACLRRLKEGVHEIDLRIWGSTWNKHKQCILSNSIQASSVEGDLYALALSSSRINIALLSEKVDGASRGDQITSRTFHIPAAGGFMLHQRTEEVLQYFDEDVEMACFSSPDELINKVKYYLRYETSREQIRQRGHVRALAEHSLDKRAETVIQRLKEKGIIGK